jgi:prepilin-type N-terminal cleavage/methylation domain-containing protein
VSERERAARVTFPDVRGLRGGVRQRRARKKRDQRGLTLVELMIVVTIIAIIAAVAFAVYQDLVKKSKLAADQGLVASLRSAVAIYYGRTNGMFPSSLTVVEGLVEPTPVYHCTVPPEYDPTTGNITFTATLADCP